MPFGGLLTVGLLGAGASIFSGINGANAAKTASQQQAQSATDALNFQKDIWSQQQGNIAPYLQSGNTSMAQLMQALGNGTFGAGSMPNAPTFNGTFHTPTAEEARATPGYEFTAQQGTKGILAAAGAAGGAISGGTLRAADTFNTGLADSTYNDSFNRSLATYNTGISAYQANLQGYQTNLAKQAQEYQQMFAPVQLGEQAATGINNQGSAVAANAGNLMTQIGNAQASGTVGSANALSQGIAGGTNSLLQTLLMNQVLHPGSAGPSGYTSSGPQIPGAIAAAQANAASSGMGPG